MKKAGFRAVLALSSALGAAPALAQQTQGTIRWDQYHVPHIYGADVPTVVRGLGYAQMENHAELLLFNLAQARGRLAEYFGAGDGNANIASDTLVRTYDIPRRASLWVTEGGSEQQQIFQAFCDGVNEYAQTHPNDIDPSLKAILPAVPADIAMGEQYTIWFDFLPEQDNDPTLISEWQAGTIGVGQPGFRRIVDKGSNGWAIAPSKSANNDVVLIGNPHLPWGINQPAPGLGIYQWIEANLVIGNPNTPTLNAQGVTFVGGPFIGIGFSDKIAWTHTNNPIKNADLYQLTLDPTRTKYLFGGTYLPLQRRTDTIKVKQANGTLLPQTINISASVHGPVVAYSTDGSKALALRVAGLSQPSLAMQYWTMIQSNTMADFIRAESALQMPFFNTIAASADQHIFYLFGGQQPVRPAGTTIPQILGILDGTDPTQLWTRTFGFTALPQAEDPSSGWIANSNNPPWNTILPEPSQIAGVQQTYPYVAPNFMDFRPQHGAIFMESQPNFTPAQLLAGKMSTHMLLADRVLPSLIAAAQQSGDQTAIAAANLLAAWNPNDNVLDQVNGTGDAGSPYGALLFEEWWKEVVAAVVAGTIPPDTTDSYYSPHPQFQVGWDPDNPISTPYGLANAAALVPYLDSATQTLAAAGVTPASHWGDVHRTVLVTRNAAQALSGLAANDAQSGADDPFGPMRVTNPFPDLSTYGIFPAPIYPTYGGDGYVQEVEFNPQTGVQASTVVTYGNVSRPSTSPLSAYETTQLPFFDAKSLKPALRTLQAVEQNQVAVENY